MLRKRISHDPSYFLTPTSFPHGTILVVKMGVPQLIGLQNYFDYFVMVGTWEPKFLLISNFWDLNLEPLQVLL